MFSVYYHKNHFYKIEAFTLKFLGLTFHFKVKNEFLEQNNFSKANLKREYGKFLCKSVENEEIFYIFVAN